MFADSSIFYVRQYSPASYLSGSAKGNMIKLAVVTVDYNNHKDTEEFLLSSKKLDVNNLEILWLVVDNGSDVSVEETVSKYQKVVWMQTGKNLGFTGGFNRGLKYAKEWGADYVLIINNDMVFQDNYL